MDLVPEMTPVHLRKVNPRFYGIEDPACPSKSKRWKRVPLLPGYSDLHVYVTPSTDLLRNAFPWEIRILGRINGDPVDYPVDSVKTLFDAKEQVNRMAAYIEDQHQTRVLISLRYSLPATVILPPKGTGY